MSGTCSPQEFDLALAIHGKAAHAAQVLELPRVMLPEWSSAADDQALLRRAASSLPSAAVATPR